MQQGTGIQDGQPGEAGLEGHSHRPSESEGEAQLRPPSIGLDLPLHDEESAEPQRPEPQVLPAPHGDQDRPREEEPILRKAPGTPRGPFEGLRTPNPSTGAPATPLPAPSTPRPATTATTPSRERSRSTPPRQEKTPRAPETEEPALHDLPAPSITTSAAGASMSSGSLWWRTRGAEKAKAVRPILKDMSLLNCENGPEWTLEPRGLGPRTPKDPCGVTL